MNEKLKPNQYRSVDEMVWKTASWKFKLKWFWNRFWIKRGGK